MSKRLNILMVDDDPVILEVLDTYLHSQGYPIDHCTSAADALVKLDNKAYDLIISDVEMAEMSGFDFVRVARERYPRIGIVLMTAFDDRYPQAEALSSGADGYIAKPFTLSKFSMIFERTYWDALARKDWWDTHVDEGDKPAE